jgi:regulatory protein YycH of two-component signal transduction system YycFG
MKPFLLLDIDGVLNPDIPDSSEFKDFRVLETPWSNFSLSLKEGQILQDLSNYVDLVWATSWEDYANEYISPYLGINNLPVISFTPHGSESLKVKDIIRFINFHQRPFIWIDDEIEDEFHSTITNMVEVEFLLVKTNPTTGITVKNIYDVYQFAKKYQ